MPWAIIKYDYLKYATGRKTIFSIFKILSVCHLCVADGMYLIEQAGVIIDWIIALSQLHYMKMTFGQSHRKWDIDTIFL